MAETTKMFFEFNRHKFESENDLFITRSFNDIQYLTSQCLKNN